MLLLEILNDDRPLTYSISSSTRISQQMVGYRQNTRSDADYGVETRIKTWESVLWADLEIDVDLSTAAKRGSLKVLGDRKVSVSLGFPDVPTVAVVQEY